MKKITVYCYKRIDGSLFEFVDKPISTNLDFIGTRTIELEEPPKEEPKRMEGWINDTYFKNYGSAQITNKKHICFGDSAKLVEIKDGERILSRDDIYRTHRMYNNVDDILKYLGFDK